VQVLAGQTLLHGWEGRTHRAHRSIAPRMR
jgi:hypothetical protein